MISISRRHLRFIYMYMVFQGRADDIAAFHEQSFFSGSHRPPAALACDRKNLLPEASACRLRTFIISMQHRVYNNPARWKRTKAVWGYGFYSLNVQ
jgi:hypothetical protein